MKTIINKLKLLKMKIPVINTVKIKFKSDKIKSKFKFKSKHILLILSVFCILLIVLTSVNDNFAKPFKAATSVVFVPIQKGMNYIGLWFSDKSESFQDLQDAIAENKKLEAKNKALEEENTLLKQQTVELENLRKLYSLDETYGEYEKVAANIIGKDPGNWFSTFMIDKGSKDGIKVDMNVIADGGLVGIVTEVGSNYATVRSIIDDESNVSSKFMSTSDLCIVNGDLELMQDNLISLININKTSQVVEGDMVFTSHISDKFLPEILIGYVNKVNEDSNSLTKTGYLTPAVDFGGLERVFVILELKENVSN